MVPSSYDQYTFSAKELRGYFLKCYCVLFVCAYVFYRNFPVALAAGVFSAAGLGIFRKSLIDERKNSVRAQFKDMLYSISSSITSGRHLKEAIEESLETVVLIHGEQAVLATEIRNMCRLMRETNCTAETALQDLADRSGIKEIADFTDVCVICQYTGGDLADMIAKAVMLLTQNIELQREKDVMLSQKKLECKILALMPVLVTALINLTAADYLAVMYTTLIGRFIMTMALFVNAGSFLWSMKMIGSRVQM